MIRASEGVCRLGGNPPSPSLPFEQSLLESPQNKYKIKIEIQIQIQIQDCKVLDWNSLTIFAIVSSSILGDFPQSIFLFFSDTLSFHTWPFWHGFTLMHTSVFVKLIQIILVLLPTPSLIQSGIFRWCLIVLSWRRRLCVATNFLIREHGGQGLVSISWYLGLRWHH